MPLSRAVKIIRHWRRHRGYILVGIGVGCVLMMWFYLLPWIVGRKAFPMAAEYLGQDNVVCTVRKVGFSQIDLSDLEFTDVKNKTLKVDSVRVDYSYFPFLKHSLRIRDICVSGAQMRLRKANGRYVVDGVDVETLLKRLASKTSPKHSQAALFAMADGSGKDSLPPVHRIRFVNCLVVLEHEGRDLFIPLSCEMTPENGDWEKVAVSAVCSPRGEDLVLNALIKPLDKEFGGSVKCSGLNTQRFTDFLPAFSVNFDQIFDLVLEVKGTYNPFSLSSADLKSQWQSSKSGAGSSSIKVDCTLVKKVDLWNCALGVFTAIGNDSKLSLSAKDIIINENAGSISADGMVECSLSVKKKNFSSMAKAALNFSNKEGAETIDAKLTGMKLFFDKFTGAVPETEWRLKRDDGVITSSVNMRSFSMNSKSFSVSVPHIHGQITMAPEESPVFVFALNNARTADNNLGLSFSDVFFNLKRTMVKDEPVVVMDFTAGSIGHKGQHISKLSLGLQQRHGSSDFSGQLSTKFLNNVQVNVSAFLDWSRESFFPDVEIRGNIPDVHPNEIVAFGEWFPDTEDLTGYFMADLNVYLTYKDGCFDAGTQLNLKNLSLNMPSKNMALHNFRTSINSHLGDVFVPTRQTAAFDLLEYGNLRLEDARVDFQIWGLKQFFIENASMNWCGGTVSTSSLRLNADMDSWEAVFYADKLSLPELINQFSKAQADGNGMVLGKIPVFFDKDGLRFSDAYLYSTPQENNRLTLKDPNALLGNIPQEAIGTSQAELAYEVIRDFEYKWLKIDFNGTREELKMKMQLDGKPTNPIPFAYDQNKKAFVRSNKIKSRFEGIVLNVNGTLPLNELINKMEGIKSKAENRGQ